jgi:hypothetical protein
MTASTQLQYGGLPAGLQADTYSGHCVIVRDQSSTTSERDPHELTAHPPAHP